MKRIIKTIVLTFSVVALCSSCDKFIFGNIEVDYKDNALTRKKMPQTAADLYKAPIVTEQGLANPDPNGALKDWATCLVMFKEGIRTEEASFMAISFTTKPLGGRRSSWSSTTHRMGLK